MNFIMAIRLNTHDYQGNNALNDGDMKKLAFYNLVHVHSFNSAA